MHDKKPVQCLFKHCDKAIQLKDTYTVRYIQIRLLASEAVSCWGMRIRQIIVQLVKPVLTRLLCKTKTKIFKNILK